MRCVRTGDIKIDRLTRTTIGKFEILELIDRGATSSVYLARDPFSGEDVAVKIAHQNMLNDPATGARFRKMFINEASLAGKLRHPHIVRVFDAGSDRDMHYIVMEFVRGKTLRQFCQFESLLPIEDVVEIVFKCSNAFEYACRQGLIHRDIKPANILIRSGTDVKVSDFGSALLADTDLTQVLDAVGTPSYMAPEQITGEQITHRADIYSLGVVMFELLTGRLPFSGSNQYELMQKITKSAPLAIEKVRSGLPASVREIVYRCLEKKPVSRYQTWSEFGAALAQVHEHLENQTTDASDTRKFNMMKRLHFFRNFSDIELWEVLRISKWHSFSGDRQLLQEGKIGGSFFVLAEGEVKIVKGDAQLCTVETGQCFGEMAYIQGKKQPRSASVVSNGSVTVIKIGAEALVDASDHLQTKFNQELLKTLAQRLERTSLLASAL